MDTVLVLICIYAALIAKGFKKIILYTLVIIFILGSVIIASLGPIEQMREANVRYRPKADAQKFPFSAQTLTRKVCEGRTSYLG
jgi:hypothetical protein